MVYPRVNPNPGITGRRAARRTGGATLLAINTIERAVVGEMGRLRTGPAAENRVDGHERDIRKLGRMLRGDFRIARAVKMPGGYFLTFLGIEVAQIFLRDGARSMLVDNFVDDAVRRFRENAQGRGDHIELVRAQLLYGEIRLVLPGQQHIADAPLHESDGGAARPRIQNRHVLVELLDELLRRGIAAARLLQRP